MDFNKINSLIHLKGGKQQIYDWKTLNSKDRNFEPGDTGFLDLVGTPEDPELSNQYLVKSIWETNCILHEVKYCIDLGKIYLSFVGKLDFSSDYVLYFNIWIKTGEPRKRNPWLKQEDLDLLVNRNLLFFYDFWKKNKNFSLGRVNFYQANECPYIHS